ncbi:MAG: PDZ domain-containing protein [Planctomycetes bacterium]|nr:PDZ domain-containing protein [Planctomycetota bacterium]
MEMLIAASIWTHPIVSTVLMLLGFGLVVFVHELGHFLVAKAVSIRVEEFALGFGKKLWSFKRGETEYRLNVLPLGGYVKMLGQEDFALAEEVEQDPRAFNQRPVWARMAFVSAGVVMNVILAAVLFFVVFSVGKEYNPPVVGGTRAGYPAADVRTPAGLETGLRPGDRITAINGNPTRRFDDLVIAGILAGKDEQFTFTVQRPGVEEPFDVTVTPARGIGHNGRISRVFGLEPATSRTLSDHEDSRTQLEQLTGGALTGGETIVSIAGKPVEHGWQVSRALETLGAEPVEIVAERPSPGGAPERVTVTIRPYLTWSEEFLARQVRQALEADDAPPFDIAPFNVLGLEPRQQVTLVEPDSTAEEAGIRPGDVVAGYDQDVPTFERFVKITRRHAGRSVPIRLLRQGSDGAEQTVTAEVEVPEGKQPRIGVAFRADQEHLVVAGVRPTSPLADANLIGSTITAINGEPVATWPELIGRAAALDAETPIILTYITPAGGQEQTAPVARNAFVGFDAADYGYQTALTGLLEPLMNLRQSSNPLTAFKYGVRETRDFIVLTYATLHGFFSGRVSGKEFTGPIGIFRAGIAVGEKGPIYVIWLLAIISANLAVINFLPLPIVDGGHAVLLMIEKVRGKPLPLAAQNIIQAAGLVLIVTLFVLLTYNDIVSWIHSS